MASKYLLFHTIALISVFVVYFSFIYYGMHYNVCDVKGKTTIISIKPHTQLFQEYLTKFNRHYKGEEFHRRLQYFLETKREIERLNRDGGHATYGLNKFSDKSKEEIQSMSLDSKYNMNSNCESKNKFCPYPTAVNDNDKNDPAVPITYYNWRDKGVVGPVLDQKNCLGCWAFSVVGVMESMVAIKRHENYITRLSIQELLDCTRAFNISKGCAARGNPEAAINFLCDYAYDDRYNISIGTEEEYPLTLRDDGKCRIPTSGVRVSRMYVECDYPADKIAEAILHGPVVAVVNPTNFWYYLGGIIQWNCEGSWKYVSHVVQIVGYDSSGEIPYFIIRNSWGTDWGENGYVKIAMDKNFLCGIGRQIAFFDVETYK